ncbi:hypothetical protein BB558_004166 [Smittium angustum]|uniref:Endonuclease LCL3 n=1 Tax=Smittium angustum TaxID=133377 RepID=A0A2U1IVL5_SMIAN|nr:hypothetical protein BB558_007229 [Smittium angustum]PVZ99777.1 hypothetical protein BB558_004166 [Smittium angustum]
MSSKALQGGQVKNVISGDTIVLRSVVARSTQPPAEKILGLAFIQAPRLGNIRKPEDDEPYSIEARDFLRKLLVGKTVGFEKRYSTNSGRDYGRVFVEGKKDVAKLLVENGWAKVSEQAKNRHNKDAASEENSDDQIVSELIKAEQSAESAKFGIWKGNNAGCIKRKAEFDQNETQFLKDVKGKPLEALIEQIRDSTTYRVYLKIANNWQLITLQLSGAKGPIVRQNIPDQPDLVEEFGIEAKNFVETRLLQRDTLVIIEGSAGGASGSFVGSVKHPAGNIAELLVANGFARVVDWSAALVTGGTEKLRSAERMAKQKKLRIWKDYTATGSTTASKFDATVIRVVNGDTLEVLDQSGKEREIQFSSIRQPKISDPQTAGYAEQAKEYLRKRLIGQKVSVKIDYHKPAQDNFRARDCATVLFENKNIAVHLLERGLAHVIRHKQNDEQRSSDYDSLLIADHSATEKSRGVHSGKIVAVSKYVDSSNPPSRAKAIFPHLKRGGRLSAIVEYVSQGSRFKLVVPRESCKITLVLGGIKCPRAGAEPSEPFGNEASLFSKQRVMQRDVEIEVSSVDNTGAFVGTLIYNNNHNLAVELLQAGLAQIHQYSANQMANQNILFNAENKAKRERKGMWVNYDESKEKELEALSQEVQKSQTQAKPNVEFIDVAVSEIVGSGDLYIQIFEQKVIESLEMIMDELSISGKQSQAGVQKAPRVGELVAAKFSSDNTWYRARVRKINAGRECELIAIDYGNVESVPLSQIKPLDSKLASYPPSAIEAKLAFLKTASSDYKDEAFNCIRSYVEGKKLVANVEARSGSGNSQVLYLTLYDSGVSGKPDFVKDSINSAIVRAGYATVDKRNPASMRNPECSTKLEELVNEAKKYRRGMWEYGDVGSDEERD